jgi:Tol biopolymer transport system component
MGTASEAQQSIGIFTDHSDVGSVLHAGSTTYDARTGTYTLRGSGTNMWSTQDAFQFAWKKMSGDVELTALARFLNSQGNEHKKAVLILRQSLDPDSVYVDIALHGNGLLAMQYREEKGGVTGEVISTRPALVTATMESGGDKTNVNLAQGLLRLQRRGKYVYMSAGPAMRGDTPVYDGESISVPLEGDFYVGIGVCAHDNNAVEEAQFSNVELKSLPPSTGQPVLYSTLETVPISSGDRQVVYFSEGRFEAPNWAHDGSYFLFNRNGRLHKLPVKGGNPTELDTGFANRCNNDHGISPDSTQIAISDNSQETKSANGAAAHDSLVYLVPIAGGTPKRMTPIGPSYWHGWSPDGKTLAFVGQRNGEFDIYTVPASGGDSKENETRLTRAKGLDDGPEYSPDGEYIYFNSERTGHMQIWRMKPDGSDQEQVFSDDYNNWFPHISPDGKWMVFLTYEKDVTGHPENKDVMLRLMSLTDKKITVLAKLFGGQGTINVPSWSPDSKSVAFVSYALIAPEDLAEHETK